jgi:hypothetical protein
VRASTARQPENADGGDASAGAEAGRTRRTGVMSGGLLDLVGIVGLVGVLGRLGGFW